MCCFFFPAFMLAVITAATKAGKKRKKGIRLPLKCVVSFSLLQCLQELLLELKQGTKEKKE